MNLISLRNLPPPLARIIRKRADERGISLNKTVIALLEEALGLRREGASPPKHDDLDHLAGRWSRAEASAFGKSLAGQRQIDAELWE